MKTYFKTERPETITECLRVLATIDNTIEEIKLQLKYEPCGGEEWRNAAEKALFICNKERKAISGILSVLRQEEREDNVRKHQRLNDFLVKELKSRVPESVFCECEKNARLKVQ
ncbi:hypothetical protein QUK01_003942 [Salmonella enterica]|nr:hypothetical protein [Salmonella enterica]